MEQENRGHILDRPHIRQACRDAMLDPQKTREVLAQMYREGFEDVPESPGIEYGFADSAQKMYDEVMLQLRDCRKDPQRWRESVVEDCLQNEVDVQIMTNGLCAVAAQEHLPEKEEAYRRELLENLARESGKAHAQEDSKERAQSLRMLQNFFETPMSGMFYTWRRYPQLSDGQRKSAACLLAMGMYIDMKCGEQKDRAPNVSFDAVCVMSSVLTEVMCASQAQQEEMRSEETQREEIQSEEEHDSNGAYADMLCALCWTMCAQYMWVGTGSVMIYCMLALALKIKDGMKRLSDLVKGEGSGQAQRVQLSERAKDYDFRQHWEPVLSIEAHTRMQDGQRARVQSGELIGYSEKNKTWLPE